MGFSTEQGLGAENRPLLCHTVAEGDMQQLKFLLEQEKKPDIYLVDDMKRNAFHHACRRGDLEMFLLLKRTYPNALSALKDDR